jgi:hypothetical protein
VEGGESESAEWTVKEDRALVRALNVYGENRWAEVGIFVESRGAAECESRWVFLVRESGRKRVVRRLKKQEGEEDEEDDEGGIEGERPGGGDGMEMKSEMESKKEREREKAGKEKVKVKMDGTRKEILETSYCYST